MHNNFTQNQLLAKEYFEEIGFTCISKDKESLLIMSGILMIDDNSYKIIATITPTFPLIYPKFHIKEQDWFLKHPHVEQETEFGNGLCIIEEKDKQYYENINLLLSDYLRRLREFLHNLYLNKFDKNEIFDEFESYWNSSTLAPIYMNPEYLSKSGLYQGNNYKNNYYIFDKFENIEYFFNISNVSISKVSFLHFHFEHQIDYIPTTYKELYQLIKNSNQISLLKKYINNKTISNLLTFSFLSPLHNKRIYTGIYIKNFTTGNTTYPYYSVFKNRIQNNKKLLGFTMKNIQKERLYNRGGTEMCEKLNRKNKTVAIVGCGSVGSSLAYKLFKSGITNLVLVDSQKLSIDNINRHLLGQEYVGINKATATKKFLDKQLLNSSIKAIPHHIENNIETLKNVDLIVLALADDAPIVEEEIAKQSIIKKLPKTIVLWLEANALAGHSIIPNQIQNYQNIQDVAKQIAILNTNYSKSFIKSDIGCNGSYMPYSFIDADQHLNCFAKTIIEFLHTNNTHAATSSIGNINDVPKESLLNTSLQSNSIIERKEIA
jgi:molybdopterin/thiamine biosynthesis adenylyltransferase